MVSGMIVAYTQGERACRHRYGRIENPGGVRFDKLQYVLQ